MSTSKEINWAFREDLGKCARIRKGRNAGGSQEPSDTVPTDGGGVYEDEAYLREALEEVGAKHCDAKTTRRRKQILVDIKGGECAECGYNKTIYALDFHHLDPDTKPFNVAWAGRNFTDEQFIDILIPHVKEATKLLCANCHREEHYMKKPRP